jgi:hypothetical protein
MTQRIIIFDSPDGTGKTTIAKGMSMDLGIPYFKYNGEHDYWREKKFKTALEFDQPFMLQYLKQTGAEIIWDRAWPAEWVYSCVFERETNHEVSNFLNKEYAKLGAWIIVPMRHNYLNNKQDQIIPYEKLIDIHNAYDIFCNWTDCNTIRIYVDTFAENLEKELEAIYSLMRIPTPYKQTIVLEGK